MYTIFILYHPQYNNQSLHQLTFLIVSRSPVSNSICTLIAMTVEYTNPGELFLEFEPTHILTGIVPQRLNCFL